MTGRSAIGMSGVALAVALALWIGLSEDDDVVAAATGNANLTPLVSPADPPAPLDLPPRSPPATPTAPSPLPLPAPPPDATGVAVPIAIAAPHKVFVGEMNDLIVSIGANAGFSEIGFTVQFDPDVLQVRAGTQGSWAVAVGFNPRFAAEISGAEDRVQIRSMASDPRAGLAGGSVATVQFQALAAGTTSVLITDVVVKDSRGRSLTSQVSASNLQITVESVPQRALPRPPAPAAADLLESGAEAKGD